MPFIILGIIIAIACFAVAGTIAARLINPSPERLKLTAEQKQARIDDLEDKRLQAIESAQTRTQLADVNAAYDNKEKQIKEN